MLLSSGVLLPPGAAAADRQLLWGDTHLHTTYSFDAFLNNNLTADPDTAYRFARGQPVIHPWHRARMQLRTPLDFLVVSDHAEFLGRIRDIYHNGLQEEDAGLWDSIVNWYTTRTLRRAVDAREGPSLFRQVLPQSGDPVEAASVARNLEVGPIPPDPDVSRSAWGEIVAAAEAHNQPGTFTTLLGWEWSALPGGANLHRVVVTDAGASQARAFQPFSSLDSPYPEDLWQWLEKKSETTGARFLAIPHNSNISKGFMFSETTLRGEPVDAAYARQRMRWERIVEVTQIKGDSEAHFLLSPEDEFAGFEVYPFYIQQGAEDYVPRAGDYARSGLKTGLELEASLGVNPFRFGMIGSTDSHTGLSTADENNFGGKMATDSTPETKLGPVISGGVRGWTMSASGLAAVWAEENTREAIFDAMQRRETYATTGPRIRVRFFGGWDFTDADLKRWKSLRAPRAGACRWGASCRRLRSRLAAAMRRMKILSMVAPPTGIPPNRPGSRVPGACPKTGWARRSWWLRTRIRAVRTSTACRSSRAGSTKAVPHRNGWSMSSGPVTANRVRTASCRRWATRWIGIRPATATASVRRNSRRCGATRLSMRRSRLSTTFGSSRFRRPATRSSMPQRSGCRRRPTARR